MRIISLLFLLFLTAQFCKGFYPFNPKFFINKHETTKKIEYKYNLRLEQQNTINKINGVYALIGPNINIRRITSLFDLFLGDGMIQSIFFDNGELTYVKHFVRTEKLLYEENSGKLPTNMVFQMFFLMINKMGIFPNTLGLANTAIMSIHNKNYALYERDHPYLLDINFSKKTIKTIQKVKIPTMTSFSAHSKFNTTIDTIEYDVLRNRVIYYELTENFSPIHKRIIPMTYLPIVHDFLKTPSNKIIVIDSPIVVDFSNMFKKTMPIMVNSNDPTFIHVLSKNTMKLERYEVGEAFYVFHYADYKETETDMEIYACLYNKLDFSTLTNKGKYRKIVIHKETGKVSIIKDTELEKLDLEFPVKIGEDGRILFRNIENNRMNGFVVCKDLDIIKKIEFKNRFISGEPAIHTIDSIPYLFTFAFDDRNNNRGYLIIMNMDTYEEIEIPIEEPITIGFHSIFIPKINL